MKGDFTRFTFDPAKHYSGVRMQQGRVQIDADWNEQVDIQAHHLRTMRTDLIGRYGAPDELHFKVQVINQRDIAVAPGRYYLDGILCENHGPGPKGFTSISAQPDLPGYILPNAPGNYWAYLDVWERHITAVEDRSIREVALGGPDTTTRTKTVWQLKLQLDPGPGKPQLIDENVESGGLRARATIPGPGQPCRVSAKAGFHGMENLLYRVEIHGDSRDRGQKPAFKWSRDNGSLVAQVKEIAGQDLIISSDDRDTLLRFNAEQWVEVTTERRMLYGRPGELVRIEKIEGNTLTIADRLKGDDLCQDGYRCTVRAWDGYVPGGAAFQADGFQELDDGIEVEFEPDCSYRNGACWMIPARTVTGDVDWPRNQDGPLPQQPIDVDHRYVLLAELALDNDGTWKVRRDRRRVFSPMTHIQGRDPGIHVIGVKQLLPGGRTDVLRNDSDVTVDALEFGLQVDLDDYVNSPITRANCFVVLDVPWEPAEDWWAQFRKKNENQGSPGFRTIVLDAEDAKTGTNVITWKPSTVACSFLRQQLEQMIRGPNRRLLARLTLKGDFIYKYEHGRIVYLDGEVLGRPGENQRIDLALSKTVGSGDDRRGGTFEMWFWVVPSSELSPR